MELTSLACAALVGLFAGFGIGSTRGRRGRRGRPGRDARSAQGAGRPEPDWEGGTWQLDRVDLKVGHDYGHALNGYRVLVLGKSGEGEALQVDGLMWHETRGELVEVKLHDGELVTTNPDLIPDETRDTCLCGECDDADTDGNRSECDGFSCAVCACGQRRTKVVTPLCV